MQGASLEIKDFELHIILYCIVLPKLSCCFTHCLSVVLNNMLLFQDLFFCVHFRLFFPPFCESLSFLFCLRGKKSFNVI